MAAWTRREALHLLGVALFLAALAAYIPHENH